MYAKDHPLGGQKKRLREELKAKLLKAYDALPRLPSGKVIKSYTEAICRRYGVPLNTFYNWLKKRKST